MGIYLSLSLLCVILSLKDGLVTSQNLKAFDLAAKQQGKYVIGIISPHRRGEKQQALMVQQAAQRLGYMSYVYSFNDLDMNFFIPAKYMNALVIKFLDFMYRTDFHLIMSFHVNIPLSEPNIMYISVPQNYMVRQRKLEEFPTLYNYNKFLDINFIHSKHGIMQDLLGREVKEAYAMVGIPANTYKTSSRHKLLMFGSIWGRNTENFYAALTELAQKDYMFFLKHPMLLFGKTIVQKFSHPASNNEELQNLLNEYGIALCVHSKFHNEAGLPSNRIFEIIAAGAIAICDKNLFVMKYFGNNVLYFDSTSTKEEIVKQVDEHIKWIKTHPKEAEEMAKKAHQIVQDKFTTEKFVEDLVKFYEAK